MSDPTGARRYFLETWGCQMNELDSQRMAGQLMQDGLLPTHEPLEADVILLNSCSVREKAAQKVYSRLGEYRLFKKDRPSLRIGLCGCVAQQEGQRALDRVPDLDFVLGPARVGELRSILARREAGERVLATGFPEHREFDIDAVSRDGSHKGMVTLIEGCNKRCTFCIVPTTRGPERSRSLRDILAEVRHLLDYGFLEIELLGQTVNHWRDPELDLDFADLLAAIAPMSGLRRLRFLTSYPRDFTPRMVEQVGAHANICPFIHLPVQSGSDRVLRRMGRGYSVDEFRQLVRDLRAVREGLAISTDFIVGFPGETLEDHQASLDLITECRFATLFAFKYSPRPGTAALKLGDGVEDVESSRRLQELFDVQNAIQLELNEELVGATLEVLVTGWGRQAGTLTGRSPCHRIVHFPANASASPRIGQLAQIVIERAMPHSLLGQEVSIP
ncbi:MAG: tRNA (N6-isopentenyl adenosine(37)-C2)-methylthiotransferase MiaB [Acidobacteriota bacterium]